MNSYETYLENVIELREKEIKIYKEFIENELRCKIQEEVLNEMKFDGKGIKEIHKRCFPDMSFGQFILNALGWINSTKKRDPFFPEEDEMLNLIKEYANANSMWYQGWNLLNK